ncbi:unnamed protein product [Eruca vesicaria subsp. sativa]|uniref:Uncharacterized protein n=1 Tax=Eruca vesicaria subsp. sativa TaxID=29727 RepID=A0ABC8L8G5_ERUVS|nr:unnamed protein product [Eruca vesicaria subsp. sativa]
MLRTLSSSPSDQACAAEWNHNSGSAKLEHALRDVAISTFQNQYEEDEIHATSVDVGAQVGKSKPLKNRAQVVNELSLVGLESVKERVGAFVLGVIQSLFSSHVLFFYDDMNFVSEIKVSKLCRKLNEQKETDATSL